MSKPDLWTRMKQARIVQVLLVYLGVSWGILQVVALCKVLQTGWIPPTINLDNPDPGCDLDYVAGQARRNNVTCALANSQGVGGTQSAAILKKG